jgi:hypothetical protein
MKPLVTSNDRFDALATKKRIDQTLDKALEDSFPGSDPADRHGELRRAWRFGKSDKSDMSEMLRRG